MYGDGGTVHGKALYDAVTIGVRKLFCTVRLSMQAVTVSARLLAARLLLALVLGLETLRECVTAVNHLLSLVL